MDERIARTLGELEQKLGELERELAAVGEGRLVDEAARQVSPNRLAGPPAHAQQAQVIAPGALNSPIPDGLHGRPTGSGARPSDGLAGSLSQAPPQAQRTTPPGAQELLRFRERLEQTAAELTRDYDRLLGGLSFATSMSDTAAKPTTSISFARGAPSLDIIDVEGLREAAERAFASDPSGTTAYGTSVGYPKLRAWIAERHGVAVENVLVTNGSMQADAFLFEQLVGAGDEVIVERPTYDRTLLSLRKRGARIHAVELEIDGINTDALARLLAGPMGAKPKLAHVIPNFQNPAGYTLSEAKRLALLALAAEHGFVVFEDDPYGALRFSGEQLPTMLSLDPERVVYASSFSKTVCPGIRVGYLVGPRELIAGIAELATNTYISPSMVSQGIVYEFCVSGAIERSILTVKQALSERADALAQALRRELPQAEFVAPQGGYFMWVTLPYGTDVDALFRAAAERGLAFVKGTDFVLEGGENTLRIAYSGVTPAQIEEGVQRLAAAYHAL